MTRSHTSSVTVILNEPKKTGTTNQDTAHGHRRQVCGLSLCDCNRFLFSAGRDGMVRQWDLKNDNRCVAEYSEHSDWVNDVVTTPDHAFIASCSSDKTIKIWPVQNGDNNDAEYPVLIQSSHATLLGHTDYVQKLAFGPSANLLASAGLDKVVHLWDVHAGVKIATTHEDETIGPTRTLVQHPRSNGPNGANAAMPDVNSIYSLGMTGHLVAAGSSDNVIRVWDSRTSLSPVMRLVGHTGNIRCLVFSPDGTRILSGGGDRTIRIWDVAHQACVSTIRCHRDSVWSLGSDESFTRAISGSRDGYVFATSLRSLESECVSLLAASERTSIRGQEHQPSPVSSLVVTKAAANPHVIMGCDSGDIGMFSLQNTYGRLSTREVPNSPIGRRLSRSVTGMSPKLGAIQDEPLVPLELSPVMVIPGQPAVIKHCSLDDKRHVLTEKTDGTFALWDVCTCSYVSDIPADCEFQDKVNDLNKGHHDALAPLRPDLTGGWMHRPSWFSANERMGCLTISFEKNSAFSCVTYAEDTPGVVLATSDHATEPVKPDKHVNLGEAVLHGIFRNFLEHWATQYDGSSGDAPIARKVMFPVQGDTPVIISDHGVHGAYFARSEARATSTIEARIPSWVIDQLTSRSSTDQAKMGFKLMPYVPSAPSSRSNSSNGEIEKSNKPKTPQQSALTKIPDILPELPPNMTTLAATPIFPIHKVQGYVQEKLIELFPMAGPDDVDYSKLKYEILCRDHVLGPRCNLAAAKYCIWKSSKDFVLHYRAKQPTPDA